MFKKRLSLVISEELRQFVSNTDWVIRLKLNWRLARIQKGNGKRTSWIPKSTVNMGHCGWNSSNSEISPQHWESGQVNLYLS